MDIYLDIDGVLVSDSLENNRAIVPYALELLKALTEKHNCFWLTTHCHNGENHAAEFLMERFPAEAKAYLDKIQPTDWGTWKTDAIDFRKDFRWIDDDVYELEIAVLREKGCEDKLIKVDLAKNPNQLREVIARI